MASGGLNPSQALAVKADSNGCHHIDAKDSYVAAGGLNPSQAIAVKAALTQTLTLWQGPPGTGKTTTLLHFLRLATQMLAGGEGQILVTAASNLAVDALVKGLRKLQINVVRMGSPAVVSSISFSWGFFCCSCPQGQN